MPGPPACASFAVRRRRHRRRASSYREFTQHFPQPGLGRARRRRDLGRRAGDARRARRAPRRARSPPSASPTSARRSSPGTAAPGSRCHRAIVWQDRRTAARCDAAPRRRASSRLVRATTGLVLDPYFSATKAEWLLTEGGVDADARPRPRHRRRLGAVEPHRRARRRRARHRAVQRQPHDALRHPDAGVVRRAARPLRRAAVAPCPRCGRRAAASASPPPAPGVPAGHPGVGHRRRPAGRAVRPGLPRAGHDEEHLRHRQLRAHERRATRAPSRSRACSPPSAGRSPTARTRLRARGRHLRHRRRRAVAARRPRHHRARPTRSPRSPPPCPTPRAASSCPPSPGSAARGGTRTPAGTIVGITRGTGRGHLARAVLESISLQTRDVVDGDERGVGPPDPRAQGRRRRVGQRPAAPAPGRRPAGAGVAAGGPGDHRARRRLPGRAGRGRVVVARRDHRQLAARHSSVEPDRRPQRAADAALRRAGERRASSGRAAAGPPTAGAQRACVRRPRQPRGRRSWDAAA